VIRRNAAAAAAAAAWLVVLAVPAAADPAGPTDYRTEVTAITPAVAGLTVEVIGGDSFISLSADPDLRVEVIGYRGEPYLRYLPGGTVEENRNSPTTYLNLDRYAAADVPDRASAAAAPEWRVVATDGSYAWHDHRTHWMNEARPPGRSPGDVILEGVVPLLVDGSEVDVTVRSIWVASPSSLPILGGMAAGLLLVAAGALGRIRVPAVPIATMAAAATATGAVAFVSVPPETGPSWMLWAPPAVALGAAAAAAVGSRRRPAAGWPGALAAIAALQILFWGFGHREWMWKPILPTAAPFWVDRSVAAAALTAGVGLTILVGRSLAARARSAPL
jgi:hypothetical protein